MDLTTFHDIGLKYSRIKRQASSFGQSVFGVFSATLLFEFTRMFIDATIR